MTIRSSLIVALVLAAAGVAVFAVWRETGRDRKSADLADAFVYDVDRYRIIPPEKIGYRETARIDSGFDQVTALAVASAGEIAVGGDREVRVFASDGARLHAIPTDETPLALAFSSDGVLHVAFRRQVRRGPLAGPLTRLFEIPGDSARITSIAVGPRAVYVADWGTRGVWVYSRDGEFEERIGDEDEDRNVPGFVVPSPWFDLLLAPDGLLRIVDPGGHRIHAFTTEGDLELTWGKPSFALDGFCGCCNPSHLAMFPDGRFVTSEKGIPRVKVYDASGRFVTAVVGPEGLATEKKPCDVAVDGSGRILVLDPGASAVRVFEPLRRSPLED